MVAERWFIGTSMNTVYVTVLSCREPTKKYQLAKNIPHLSLDALAYHDRQKIEKGHGSKESVEWGDSWAIILNNSNDERIHQNFYQCKHWEFLHIFMNLCSSNSMNESSVWIFYVQRGTDVIVCEVARLQTSWFLVQSHCVALRTDTSIRSLRPTKA